MLLASYLEEPGSGSGLFAMLRRSPRYFPPIKRGIGSGLSAVLLRPLAGEAFGFGDLVGGHFRRDLVTPDFRGL